jgi:hypothetical protein
VVERIDFFFALLYLLPELVRPVEVLTDLEIFGKLLNFLQLPLNLNQLFVEDLLLVLQLLGQLSLSLSDYPLGLPHCVLDHLRPLFETPETAESEVVDLIEILLKS